MIEYFINSFIAPQKELRGRTVFLMHPIIFLQALALNTLMQLPFIRTLEIREIYMFFPIFSTGSGS